MGWSVPIDRLAAVSAIRSVYFVLFQVLYIQRFVLRPSPLRHTAPTLVQYFLRHNSGNGSYRYAYEHKAKSKSYIFHVCSFLDGYCQHGGLKRAFPAEAAYAHFGYLQALLKQIVAYFAVGLVLP